VLRLITFLEEAAGVELVLPVTPAGYQWAHEAAIETVTVDQLGDLNFFGGKRMGSTTLHDCLLPAQAYPFLSPGAGTNPWLYLEQLERWVDKGTVVRWMVSGTPVNAAVLLEGVTYREQDGTNDLYADITLRQYTRPETFMGKRVPEVLLTGHHKNIDAWRRKKSVERTLERRPELLRDAVLSAKEKEYLRELLEKQNAERKERAAGVCPEAAGSVSLALRGAWEVIDLTQEIREDMPMFPGDEPPVLERVAFCGRDGYRETKLTFYSHTGTHADAPSHIADGRTRLEQFPLGHFIGQAFTIDASGLAEGESITMELIALQVKSALAGVPAEKVRKCVIAYEPIWAIGTGKTATAEQAAEVCTFIRTTVRHLYGARIARSVTVQYGGSMKPANAAELLSQPDIDGGLIGGASLKAADFVEIVNAANQE